MLKKRSSFLNAILFFIDMVIVWGSWGAAYFLCFHITLFHVGNNPAFETHLSLVFFVILIYALVFRLAGLYKPMRMHKITDGIFSLLPVSAAISRAMPMTLFQSGRFGVISRS